MKRTGAELARFALEQIGVRFTFGIPGVHNTELYDTLADSKTIRPVRVGHEGCAAFMADAVSRTSASIGTLLIVPAAGTTLALPGMGEAFIAGIPMLVISGGVRSDSAFHHKVHELDQRQIVAGYTKAAFCLHEHRQIVPTIYEAYRIAVDGEPGPVFVEIPANIQILAGDVDELPVFTASAIDAPVDEEALSAAVHLLEHAQRPGIFLGYGARGATDLAIALAERLQAPVATTLQGLSVFPASHPLHTGMSFGAAAVPAAQNAFADCDCVIAIGTRFSEIATGGFTLDRTWQLVHVDIDSHVFNVNYDADVAIRGDARQVLRALLERLPAEASSSALDRGLALCEQIARDKQSYRDEWLAHDPQGRVNPLRFFDALRGALGDEAIVVADDGNHTFLTAELLPMDAGRQFISPTEFNCMGYCIPAAIGAQLANPDQRVVGIVGDGAFLMTCTELLTAVEARLPIVYFVFHDGELSQVAQTQALPYQRKTCSVLPAYRLRGFAEATGAQYRAIANDGEIDDGIRDAFAACSAGPVLVDVRIDYSKATRFTKGFLKANFQRLPLGAKLRMAGRALARRLTPLAVADE